MFASVTFFALIAPLFLALLGVALCVVGGVCKRSAVLALGASLCSSSAGLSWQIVLKDTFSRDFEYLPLWFVMGFSLCYICAALCAAHALAVRWRVTVPWLAAAVLSLAVLLYQAWFTVFAPNMMARIYGLSFMLMVLFGLPLLRWRSWCPHNRYDVWLRWMCVALLVVHVVRTLVQLRGLAPMAPDVYLQTWFWWGVNLFIMLTSVALVLLLAMAEVTEVVARLRAERAQDPLTQLLNRRGFDEKVRQLLAQPRLQGPWVLLVLDLDHFKVVNDRWGHPAGDVVLQGVAQQLQKHATGANVLARFGGEEFVMLAHGLNERAALLWAQAIRQEVAALAFSELQGQGVTASIGMTMLETLAQPQLHRAFQAADAQLYAAKRGGRNRVACCVQAQ